MNEVLCLHSCYLIHRKRQVRWIIKQNKRKKRKTLPISPANICIYFSFLERHSRDRQITAQYAPASTKSTTGTKRKKNNLKSTHENCFYPLQTEWTRLCRIATAGSVHLALVFREKILNVCTCVSRVLALLDSDIAAQRVTFQLFLASKIPFLHTLTHTLYFPCYILYPHTENFKSCCIFIHFSFQRAGLSQRPTSTLLFSRTGIHQVPPPPPPPAGSTFKSNHFSPS